LELSRSWVQEKFVIGFLLEVLDDKKVEAVLQVSGDLIFSRG
jgi:hypothetical protein